MASTQIVGEAEEDEESCSIGCCCCTDMDVVRRSEGKTGRPEKPQTESGGVGWVVVVESAGGGGCCGGEVVMM